MSQVFPRRVPQGCPDCGVLFGHSTICPRTSWLPRVETAPVRTAIAANAAACARQCRDVANCGWPNCACPALTAMAKP